LLDEVEVLLGREVAPVVDTVQRRKVAEHRRLIGRDPRIAPRNLYQSVE